MRWFGKGSQPEVQTPYARDEWRKDAVRAADTLGAYAALADDIHMAKEYFDDAERIRSGEIPFDVAEAAGYIGIKLVYDNTLQTG